MSAGREAFKIMETLARDADSAGVAVVQKDRRRARLPVEFGREAADVPAVAHREERKQGDEAVFGGMQGSQDVGWLDILKQLLLKRKPQAIGLEGLGGQLQVDNLKHLVVGQLFLLVCDHMFRHQQPAE